MDGKGGKGGKGRMGGVSTGKIGMGRISQILDMYGPVFAYPFPLNSGAPIASANFISDGKCGA